MRMGTGRNGNERRWEWTIFPWENFPEIFSVVQGGPKNGAILTTIILSILNRLKKFSLEDALVNLQLNGYKKISPYLVYVATLPCETLMSAKQAINDKLQGSVATYLRCGGVVNKQIKEGLLLSLGEKKLKSVNIWQSYEQERDCLVHLCAWPTHC